MDQRSPRPPRRSGRISTVIDPQYTEPLIPLVGKFMVNFGAIELMSCLWIELLAHDDLLLHFAIEGSLANRIDLVSRLMKRQTDLPKELRKEISVAWQAARDLSQVRNAIAHNPAVFGWHGPEQGEPNFVGIPVLKKLARRSDGKVPFIGVDGLRRAVDSVVEVARDLEAYLEQIRKKLREETGQ